MQKYLKTCLFFVILFYFFSTLKANESNYDLLDKVIAIVEKEVITYKELENEKNKIFILGQKISEDDEKKLLESLIEKKIIFQYAELKGSTIDEIEIQQIIENIILKNKITLEDLENELSNDGSSLSFLKDDIKYQLTKNKILEKEIMPYVNVSEYEIDAFLANNDSKKKLKYNISHILITHKNFNDQKIKDIYKKLESNEFSKIAKEFSEGPYALEGGGLGWNEISELPDIFQKTVLSMKKGQISEAIQSSNGYHILKLNDISGVTESQRILIPQYKFLQILLKKNSITNNQELKKRIENINNLIINGLPFHEAAKKYSEENIIQDPMNLPWINLNNLLPAFKEQLNNYPKTDLIGPFETELGWHLIKVYGFNETDITNDVGRNDAKLEIVKKKSEIRFKDWLSSLKENSNIKILNDN